MVCPAGGGGMSGPPLNSANDAAVSRVLVDGWTCTPCIPGATIQPGSELRCDHWVSGEKMPGTVVSLKPGGGCRRGSEYATFFGSVSAVLNRLIPYGK